MSSLNHTSFYVYSKDHTLLHGLFWLPDVSPVAVVYLVHGLGGHVGRYAPLALALNKEKIAVIGIDLRGHGKSQGKRAYIRSLKDVFNDILAAVTHGNSILHENIPRFICGNSMGATLALQVALENARLFKGVVLTAPWFRLTRQPHKIALFFINKMSKIWPGFTFSSGLKSEDMGPDLQLHKETRGDTLVHNKITARLFCLIDDLSRRLLSCTEIKLPFPMLVFHGEKDPVTDSAASKQFSEKYHQQCELFLLKNTRHDIHLECSSSFMFTKMVLWIKDCLGERVIISSNMP
jgi:alpha-beta hydrolase superfamily lysophospholipase